MRHLNLDIVLGIICTELFAQVVLNVHVRPAWWFVVPAAAWLMYTVDRLMDVRKQGGQYDTPRHRFHLRHQRLLWSVVLIVAPITLVIAILYLLPDVWIVGAVLGSLTLLHEVTQGPGLRRYRGVIKDATVVIIYTSAVWSVPLLRCTSRPLGIWLFPAAFLLLATQNVVLFGLMEARSDETLDRSSLVRTIGTSSAAMLFHGCSVLIGGLAFAIALSDAPHARVAAMIIVVMTITLELLYAARRTVATHELYRLIGDGIFYLPVLILVAS